MSHSVIAPSFAPVWAQCPAAVMMALQHPEEESQDTRDGTAAHWVASTTLELLKAGEKVDAATFAGAKDPDETFITDEIVESAEVYVRDVYDTAVRHGGLLQLEIETSTRADRINPAVFGTGDARLYLPGSARFIQWDYKHGHKEVNPVWNEQLLCYTAGAFDEYKLDGLQDQKLQVEFRIAQPRCCTTTGPIQTFAFTASDARPHFNRLRTKADEALSETPTFNPGPQCKYCPARAHCSASRQAVLFGADYLGTPIVEDISMAGLSFELSLLRWMKPILESRLEALEVEALARIQQGEFLPGFAADRKLGHRKFVGVAKDVIDYGKVLGVDLSQSHKAVPPAEAERRLKDAGLPLDCLESLVDRPVTGVKLVPADQSQIVKVFRS